MALKRVVNQLFINNYSNLYKNTFVKRSYMRPGDHVSKGKIIKNQVILMYVKLSQNTEG